jgi:hypothetical protein
MLPKGVCNGKFKKSPNGAPQGVKRVKTCVEATFMDRFKQNLTDLRNTSGEVLYGYLFVHPRGATTGVKPVSGGSNPV